MSKYADLAKHLTSHKEAERKVTESVVSGAGKQVETKSKKRKVVGDPEEDDDLRDNTSAAKQGTRVKQKQRKWDEVINFYELLDKKPKEYRNPNTHLHGLKHPTRILLVGPTGAGKTNMLLNYINQMDCFDRVVIFCKMAEEHLYDWLKDHFHGEVMVTSDIDKLPDLNDLDDSKQTIFGFDDVICMNKKIQNRINEYFIAVRKKNASAAYITQAFYSSPKLIRLQCDEVALLRVDSNKDFKLIAKEYAQGVSAGTLEELYEDAQRNKSFLRICTTAEPGKKLRRGFGDIYPTTKLQLDAKPAQKRVRYKAFL